MSDNDKQPVPPSGDSRYLLLVGGILMVIVLTLAALWQIERRRRMASDEKLTTYSEKLYKANLVSEMFRDNMIMIDRNSLANEEVSLNGEQRKLFHVNAPDGEKMGFLPGDLVEIDNPPPASQPDEQ